MQVEGGELQSALQYQVLSTGLQHGHYLAKVGGVQHQQWSMLPSERQVSVACIIKMPMFLQSKSAILHGCPKSVGNQQEARKKTTLRNN